MFNWLKKTATKAENTLDQAQKDLSETSSKIQTVLDESGKSVQVIVDVLSIALIVSIVTNIITIGLNISSHKKAKTSVIIQNLYIGKKNE